MKFTQPKIMGIVNITEDSFSDGGQFLDTSQAIGQAQRLIDDGADIIDLGPASSNPDAKYVSPKEEIHRLEPVVNRLQELGAVISIDSFRMETQQYGMQKGVAFLNDIQGFPHPEFYAALAAANCQLILMHSIQRLGKANLVESNPETISQEIFDFFAERLQKLAATGIARDRIILDPGMGFFLGSNPESSVVVLQNIRALKEKFKLPLLISVSRKSFLRKIAGRQVEEIAPATLSAELYAVRQGADYIRTHAVRQLTDALEVMRVLESDEDRK